MKPPTLSELPAFIAEVTPLVNAYLIVRAAAEAMRIRIDAIGAEMLDIYPLRDAESGELIADVSKDWHAFPTKAWVRWNEACVEEQRKQGLRAGLMSDGHCPALVLENEQINVGNLLIEVSGKPYGVTVHNLLCSSDGLKRRQEWIDLMCGLVVKSAGYRAPSVIESSAGSMEDKS